MSDKKNYKINPYIKSRLDELKHVPPRSSERAAQTRARFLAQVAELHPERKYSLFQFSWRVFSPVMIVLLLLVLSAGTVFAAQASLPGQWQYLVKILAEDVRLSLLTDSQYKADLLMHFTDIRVDEMVRLTAVGKSIPESVVDRLIWQLDLITEVISGVDDEQLILLMARLEVKLQNYERVLTQAQQQSTQGSDAQIILRVREYVRIQLDLAQVGQSDPQQYRYMIENQHNLPGGYPTQSETYPGGTPGFENDGSGNPVPQNTQKGTGGWNGTPEPEQTPKNSGGNNNTGSTDIPDSEGGGNGKP